MMLLKINDNFYLTGLHSYCCMYVLKKERNEKQAVFNSYIFI